MNSRKLGFLICLASFGLIFSPLEALGQRTATAIATVVNGFVVAITVTEAGSEYVEPPTVILSGGGGSGSAPTPGDDGKPTGPIASLLGWMPDTIKGYTAQEPIADALYVSREYAPVTTGRIERLVIAAEQFASEGAARAELDRTLKLRYSTDGKDVTVGGHKGWFGTDGRRFAVLGLTDGSVFVVLEMSSSSVDPAKLRGDLTSVAEDLPR